MVMKKSWSTVWRSATDVMSSSFRSTRAEEAASASHDNSVHSAVGEQLSELFEHVSHHCHGQWVIVVRAAEAYPNRALMVGDLTDYIVTVKLIND